MSMLRRRLMYAEINKDNATLLTNYLPLRKDVKIIPIDLNDEVEVFGRLDGTLSEVYIGQHTELKDYNLLGNERNLRVMGHWSFSGVNHYAFRTLWKTRKVFRYVPNVIFDFTFSVKNGFHIWSEDGTIDWTINDPESMALYKTFIGNCVLVVHRTTSLVHYIKTRRIL